MMSFSPEAETNRKTSIRIRFDSIHSTFDSIRFDLLFKIPNSIRFDSTDPILGSIRFDSIQFDSYTIETWYPVREFERRFFRAFISRCTSHERHLYEILMQ